MPKKRENKRNRELEYNPYRGCADKCGLSETTIRNAFGRKKIARQTACRIGKHLGISPACFRLINDRPASPETGFASVYKCLSEKCGLSEMTMRTAFSRRPVIYPTACRIAKHLGIPVVCFRIKEDTRGRKKGVVKKT